MHCSPSKIPTVLGYGERYIHHQDIDYPNISPQASYKMTSYTTAGSVSYSKKKVGVASIHDEGDIQKGAEAMAEGIDEEVKLKI